MEIAQAISAKPPAAERKPGEVLRARARPWPMAAVECTEEPRRAQRLPRASKPRGKGGGYTVGTQRRRKRREKRHGSWSGTPGSFSSALKI